MMKKTLFVYMVALFLILLLPFLVHSVEKGGKIKIEKERADFTKLIIENPNYFGTYPQTKIKPVLLMKINTKYEELKCIGFYPEQDRLEAIVDVKLPYGYKGYLCSPGSFEYVRFFIDWDGNGVFSEYEDAGITSVNVHDISDSKKACLDNTKPISYSVTIKIDSKKRKCNNPYLVKVRAILSWEKQPAAGNSNEIPVWGNVVEKWVQIKPAVDLKEVAPKLKELTPVELKEIYKGKNIPEHRFNLKEIAQTAEKIKRDPTLIAKYKLDPKLSEIMKSIKVFQTQKYNTKYEELHCLGLNYDLDQLVATLTVKLPYGYNGDLCTKGSNEYVAFWAYVWDQIEQICIWKYLGTASVNVHDIESIPVEGLQYAVYLPVDLPSLRDTCTNPKLLKVRAILSWHTPPSITSPDSIPVWGNKVEALIQIKPGMPLQLGEQIPFISFVGGMAVNKISGNSETIIPSDIGDGYANGVNALESPFGGVISICGHISNPPNDPPHDEDKLKYKIQYKKITETEWHDITNEFWIYVSTFDNSTSTWNQNPEKLIAVGGYYKYEEDLTPPIQKFIDGSNYSGGSVLSDWHTPVPEGDGLYEIRVLLYKLGAPLTPGVPANHISSNVVKVMIDNTPPIAEISLDSGACTIFKLGDMITGKFTAKDEHIWRYSLSIKPPVVSPPTISPDGEVYPAMPEPGRVNKPFNLATTSTITPCGYVIQLDVWDRTIVNNHMYGIYNNATVGLCLLEKK